MVDNNKREGESLFDREGESLFDKFKYFCPIFAN